MRPPNTLGVSVVMATRNRRDVLLQTLSQVEACGLSPNDMEIFVVDNASTDGTVCAVAERFPEVHVLALPDNRGSCAKGLALGETRFRYVLFLDDDSWPIGDAVPRMIQRFESTPSLAAAGFMAHLPDGRMECSAMPHVFIGCGVGFRRDILLHVGGIDAWFFMQAEEYDLSFRLANAGYQVNVYDDLHVRHLKTPQARYRGTTAYYDTRNNMVLAWRFLKNPWLRIYLSDWMQRYAWLSFPSGCGSDYARGLAAGLTRSIAERFGGSNTPLSPRAFETFFCIHRIEGHMAHLAQSGVRRIILADLGKNVYAFWRGAAAMGIEVVAISDDRFAADGNRRYRGVPVLKESDALQTDFDAVVVSNTSYVHAAQRAGALRAATDRPVFDWFGRRADEASLSPS